MANTREKRKNLILELLHDKLYVPMKRRELAAFMQVTEETRKEFDLILDELLAEGLISVTKRGKLVLPDEKEAVKEEDDAPLIGTFEASKNFGFVILDNKRRSPDVFIPKEFTKGAVTGNKVEIMITTPGNENRKPEGKVVNILGHVDDPGMDILSIAMAFGINSEFPEKVLNQAEKLNKPVSEADILGREDFRDLLTITIDGEDAKDLDDAVSLSFTDEYYELGVHIADVSNYVQESSALDREAIKRGTSVYLADRVIPMLPKTLSNGICSLNEGEDRLTLSCVMKIDKKGKVTDYKICESVIRTRHRMSYTEVKKIIEDNDPEMLEKYADVSEMIYKMQELSLILRDMRKRRGAIDFDVPETKLILDAEGAPVEIKPYERNEATKLIESFMLAANETVAEHYYWLKTPFVYRVHDVPEDEKLNKLKTFIKNFGYFIKTAGGDAHPKEFQKLIEKITGTPEEALLTRLTLRSMSQAKYSTECDGHFGLACDYYTHFTSPIRRYPDLQIHRIIHDDLRNRLTEAKKNHYEEILPSVAASSSKLERRADEAERETVKLKKAQYMASHIGEIYEGVISGVVNWGIYVELENTVEGLVHISNLRDDYYHFNEEKYELVGEDSHKTFKLGDKVKIMVKSVDLSMRVVDFILADFEENSPIHDFYKNGRNSF
jgi:ribonuclease R